MGGGGSWYNITDPLINTLRILINNDKVVLALVEAHGVRLISIRSA